MASISPTTLVYFAPVPWDSYPQRPHYLVDQFLAAGGSRVVWVDPYPVRFPGLRDIRQIGRRTRVALQHPPNLTVLGLATLPWEPLGIGGWLNRRIVAEALVRRLRRLVGDHRLVVGIGRPSMVALSALIALAPPASFYDAMDDFPEFYSGRSKLAVRVREAEIARGVDLVLTSSSALWTKFEALGRRRLMIRNAFEMSGLPQLPIARNGHIRFGYVGCIGLWFDWAFVVRLARMFPHADVQLVGPCFDSPRRLPSNVHLLPACTLPQTIEHFRRFSVGLIPFKRMPLTESVDPIKYYGYRAMGLPVLSTRFGEMANRGMEHGAFVVDDAAPLEAVAANALAASSDSASIAEFRRTHTWTNRFEDAGLFEHLLS